MTGLKPRGREKRLLYTLGKIQSDVSIAQNLYRQDVGGGAITAKERAEALMDEIFALCVDARAPYDAMLLTNLDHANNNDSN